MLKEKMFFTEYLALMLKGGASLAEALEILKTEARSRRFRKTLNDVLKRILEGESLEKAMSQHPKVFDRFYQNIVRVGEKSGSLEENLKYLALKIKKDAEMKNKVKGALIYPLIIVFLVLVVAFAVTFFVLPQITNLFYLLKVELPLITRGLISFVSFSQKYWLFILSAVLVLVLAIGFLQKLKRVKFFLDRLSLSLPFLGQIFKNLNLSFFSRTFYILLKSGVPLSESLIILSETLPNEVYKRNLLSLRSKIEGGEKISQGLKAAPQIFPAVFSGMILVGERSGTLEESLLYLADYHEKEVDTALKNLSTVLEPVLLIFVGILVAFLALAIITPIYQFTGQIRFR